MGKLSRNVCLALLIAWSVFVIVLVQLSHYTKTPISEMLPIHSARFLLQMGTTESVSDESYLTMDVRIDTREMKNQSDLLKEIHEQNRNLPLWYLVPTTKQRPLHVNTSCARYPSIYDLKYNNLHWQTFHSSNGTFQLYSAFYDDRKLEKDAPVVRILGMIDKVNPTVSVYCQLWFLGQKQPIFAAVTKFTFIWKEKFGKSESSEFQPYLITCNIPQKMKKNVPKSVSLVEKLCENATNNLNVIYDPPVKKKGFAVCVKGLDFLHDDMSIRLVEWIELIHMLGADKIFFYELGIHPNISKVLKYYQEKDLVDSTPITLPGGQPNIPGFQHLYLIKRITTKRQNELIPYNDCFYRNMYKYKYIVLLDIDEVIMPVEESNWKELLASIKHNLKDPKNKTFSSFHARNVYFLDTFTDDEVPFLDIPQYMHMLQHVYRADNFSRPWFYVKSFHNTKRVLAVHNHLPIACIGGPCKPYSIDASDAQMHHYRIDCPEHDKDCQTYKETFVKDTTIWKYKDVLIDKTSKALIDLGFIW